MRTYELQRETILPVERNRVFEFFSDAFRLEDLTPPWLQFEVLTPRPIAMQMGTVIDYRLKLHAIPIRWRTEITVWEPPVRFVDCQVRGPYRLWRHEHTFDDCDCGTRVRDRVEYAIWLGPLVHRLFVQRDLREIFDYRQRKLVELFQQPSTESAQ